MAKRATLQLEIEPLAGMEIGQRLAFLKAAAPSL